MCNNLILQEIVIADLLYFYLQKLTKINTHNSNLCTYVSEVPTYNCIFYKKVFIGILS